MRHAKRIANRFIQSSPEVAKISRATQTELSDLGETVGTGSVGRYGTENMFPATTIKSMKPPIVKSQLQLQANFGNFRAFAHWTIPHFRYFPVREESVTILV